MEEKRRSVGSELGQLGPSAADARAETPRMQITGVGSHNILAPTPQQLSHINPYLLGATAGALSFAAAGHSPLLLAAAAAARNAPNTMGMPNQLLLHPQAALYQNPYLFNSPAVGLNPNIQPTLAAMYYNQLAAQVVASSATGNLNFSLPSASSSFSPAAQAYVDQRPNVSVQPPPPPTRRPGHPSRHDLNQLARRQSAPILDIGGNRAASMRTNNNSPGSELSATWANADRGRHTDSSGSVTDNSGAKAMLSSPEAIQEHISRLISENEAIVEPMPPILNKRRSYQRHQSGSNLLPAGLNSQQHSPVEAAKPPGAYQNRAIRSHSLIEGSLLQQSPLSRQLLQNLQHGLGGPLLQGVAAGSRSGETVLPSPPIHASSPSATILKHYECRYCKVGFSNEKSLDYHVFRCNGNTQGNNSIPSQPQHVLLDSGGMVPPHPAPAALPPAPAPTSPSSPTPNLPIPNPKTNFTSVCASSISSPTSSFSSSSVTPSKESIHPLRNGVWDRKHHPLKKRILAAAAEDEAAIEIPPPAKIPKVEIISPLPVFEGTTTMSTTAKSSLHPPLQRVPAVSVQQNSLLALQTPPPPVRPIFSRPPRPSLVKAQSQILLSPTAPTASLQQGMRKVGELVPQKCTDGVVVSEEQSMAVPVQMAAAAHLQVLFPQVSLSATERDRQFRPYCVTVQVPNAQSFEAPRSGRRPRQVTAPTFVCLKRPQPMSLPQSEPKLSMYSTWQQAPVNPVHAKLNVMWMGGCCTKPRFGSSFWKYTVANKQLNVPRMTHSSFWEMSKKALERQKTGKEDTEKLPKEGEEVVHEDDASVASKTHTSIKSISTQTTKTSAVSVIAMNSSEKENEERTNSGENSVIDKSSQVPRQDAPSLSNAVLNVPIVVSEQKMKEEEVKPTTSVPSTLSQQTTKEKLRGTLLKGSIGGTRKPKWKRIFNGGFKTDEVYTYVRGRGRGRYVCEQCGIRCRKPSMLQKHIKTHQNIRPFSCTLCSFSFKTKGNLTKHLKSKAHWKKSIGTRLSSTDSTSKLPVGSCFEEGDKSEVDYDSDDNRLEIDSNAGSTTESADEEEDEGSESEGEEAGESDEHESDFYSLFRRKRLWMPHRSVHTPPPQRHKAEESGWKRNCTSVPVSLVATSCTGHSLDALKTSPEDAESEVGVNDSKQRVGEETPSKSTQQSPSASTSTAPHGTPNRFLIPSKGNVKCEECGKEFPDSGKLRLHMFVHSYEQQRPNRRNVYSCPACSAQMRTKTQLQKHIGTAHSGWEENMETESSSVNQSIVDGQLPATSKACSSPLVLSGDSITRSPLGKSSLPVVPGPGNPRPFYCHECEKGFRIHGHLAKHLRSKQHITHLESMEKLPIGTYAAIEGSKEINLAEDVDTSDCDSCLQALKDIATRLNLHNNTPTTTSQDIPSNDGVKIDREKNELVSSDSHSTNEGMDRVLPEDASMEVSLECTEDMISSPSPPPLVVSTPTTSSSDVASGSLVLPTPTHEYSTLGSATLSLINGTNASSALEPITSSSQQRSVVADVWVPPKESEITEDSGRTRREGGGEMDSPSTSVPSLPNGVEQCNGEMEKEESVEMETERTIVLRDEESSHCIFCKMDFATSTDLEIHLHADHIAMKDGNDFKCPRANCDKVYPNKENLRHHIAAHFHGGNGGSVGSSERDGDVSRETMVALQRKLGAGGAPGPNTTVPAGAVGNQSQSPGTPEESQTSVVAVSGGRKKFKTHLVSLNSIPEATGLINAAAVGGSDFKSPGSVGNNSPISDNSDGASRASSSQSTSPTLQLVGGPATLGKPLHKRKSIEDGMVSNNHGLGMGSSPLTLPSLSGMTAKRLVSPDGRRCVSATDQSPSVFPSAMGGGLQPPSLSMPAVPALLRLSDSANPHALAWLTQGLTSHYNNTNPLLPSQLLYPQQSPTLNPLLGFGGLNGGRPNPFLPPYFRLNGTPPPSTVPASSSSSFCSSPATLLNGGTPGGSDQHKGSTLVNGKSTPTTPSRHCEERIASNSGEVEERGEESSLPCPVCQKSFPNSTALQRHILLHVQSRPHVCEQCDAGFTTPAGLNSHLLTHHPPPPANQQVNAT